VKHEELGKVNSLLASFEAAGEALATFLIILHHKILLFTLEANVINETGVCLLEDTPRPSAEDGVL
jgi:hypothetical protein